MGSAGVLKTRCLLAVCEQMLMSRLVPKAHRKFALVLARPLTQGGEWAVLVANSQGGNDGRRLAAQDRLHYRTSIALLVHQRSWPRAWTA